MIKNLRIKNKGVNLHININELKKYRSWKLTIH